MYENPVEVREAVGRERDTEELTRDERLALAAGPLCEWYRGNRRQLPWREDVSAYRVWISEIMLQQTRVEAVKPYFARFLEAAPDVRALAALPDDRLMKLWEGLGYYSRARNLKKAAGICVERYGGQLPGSYRELLALPGIGSYTAGAISSIVYREPRPAVDGNVLRVLHRLWEDGSDIARPEVKKRLEDELEAFLRERAQDPPGDFNQALMELGACVCIPNGEPRCEACPIGSLCLTCRDRCFDRIPYKAPKPVRRQEERTVFLIFDESGIVLHKRPAQGLLAGMYELPGTGGKSDAVSACRYWEELLGEPVSAWALKPGKHVFTHVQWNMVAWRIRLQRRIEAYRELFEAQGYDVAPIRDAMERYALPSAFHTWDDLWQTL